MSVLSRLKTFCYYIIEQQLIEDAAAFERRCGLVPDILSNERESTLNDSIIETICTLYPQLNAKWIRTGKGNMLNYTISEDYNSEEKLFSPTNRAVNSKKDILDIDLKQDNEKAQSLVLHKELFHKAISEKNANKKSYTQSTFTRPTIQELEKSIKENSRKSENGINYLEKEYQILLSAFPLNIRLLINKYLPTAYDYVRFINSKYQFSSLLKERDDLNLFVKLYGIIYSDFPLKKYDGYDVYQQYQRNRNNIESFKAKESSTPFAHYVEESTSLQNSSRKYEKHTDSIIQPKVLYREKSYSNGLYDSSSNTIVLSTYGYGDRLYFIYDDLLYQSQPDNDHYNRADFSTPYISYQKKQIKHNIEQYSDNSKSHLLISTKMNNELEETTRSHYNEENNIMEYPSDNKMNNHNDEMEKLLKEPIYTIPEEEKRSCVRVVNANIKHKSGFFSEVLYQAINERPGDFLTINIAIFRDSVIQDIQKEHYNNPSGIVLGKFTIQHDIDDTTKIIIFPSR